MTSVKIHMQLRKYIHKYGIKDEDIPNVGVLDLVEKSPIVDAYHEWMGWNK